MPRLLRFAGLWFIFLVWSVAVILLRPVLGKDRTWRLCGQRWTQSMLWCGGIRYTIEGVHHLVGPVLYAVNHRGVLDVIMAPAFLPAGTLFLAKREIGKIPIIGWAASVGCLLINRKAGTATHRALFNAVAHRPSASSIAVFPEGTRSNSDHMGRFKRGIFHMALQTRLPIIPVGIVGSNEALPKGAIFPRPTDVTITVGKPLCTENWRIEQCAEKMILLKEAVDSVVTKSQQRY